MKTLLTLGDSIAHGYRRHLIEALGSDYDVTPKVEVDAAAHERSPRYGTKGADSSILLTYLENEYENGRLDYDIITFNCGQHDVKTNLLTGQRQISAEDYEKNFEKICQLFGRIDAKVYFVNSTPVFEEVHNTPENIVINRNIVRYSRDILTCNAAAGRLCAQYGIPVIDLYSLTLSFGKESLRDHAHYYPEYEQRQGRYIASCLLADR